MAPNFTTNENSFSKSRSTQTKGSADTFWQMRIKECLPSNLPRSKWFKVIGNLKPGDAVLLI